MTELPTASSDNALVLSSSRNEQSLASGQFIGPKLDLAIPRIFVSKEMTPGQTFVATAHASLAWHLKHGSQDIYDGRARPFIPKDIRRIECSEFESLTEKGSYIPMTESRRNGEQVAAVGFDVPGIALTDNIPEPPNPPIETGLQTLRMYILIRRKISYEEAKCAAANGSVDAFYKFRDDPVMSSWVNGVFVKTICDVTESQFERALLEDKHVVIPRSDNPDEPAAIAFCPRVKWPGPFNFLKLYK